jgi:hypothetical protein
MRVNILLRNYRKSPAVRTLTAIGKSLQRAGMPRERVLLRIAGKWLHGGYTNARKQKAQSGEWAKCLYLMVAVAHSKNALRSPKINNPH